MTGGSSSSGKGHRARLSLIRQCEDIIKCFNPVTHSIDTHLTEELGPEVAWGNEEWFIQQSVTGWYREKRVLDAFISNMYADNGARITRADMIMYTILSYLALFRLKELGFPRFKELCATEDPSKVGVFVSYLFSKEVLWSSLRDSWMRIVDLKFTEDTLISGIERYLVTAEKYLEELLGAANSVAAAEAAKEEAKKNGTAGMGEVLKKRGTRPVSPKLTRPRPPQLPEPDKIEAHLEAKEVPSYLNNNTIAKLEATSKERRMKVKSETLSKYEGKGAPTLNETKFGKKIDQLRAEAEELRAKELAFDATFITPVPDYNASKAVVRVNAATILREDFLYRKQQAKDAAVLKNYEEELRDPVEYFAWQQKMKEGDEQAKLENVLMRRRQAKESSEEAHRANEKLLADNVKVASLMRTQARIIDEKRAAEHELVLLSRQVTVSKITEVRDYNPHAAVEAAAKAKRAVVAEARVDLEAKLAAKAIQDKLAEEAQADKIRQLRAENDVHKSRISVFDPTKVSGMAFLDNMSYMEMKERTDARAAKEEAKEQNKRGDILESKQKRAQDLQNRADSVLRARKVKAEAFKAYYSDRRTQDEAKKEAVEKHRITAAIQLEEELRLSRTRKNEAAAALLAEQEKIKRAQAYLGAAAGQKEEAAAEQLQMARERAIKAQQVEYKHHAKKLENIKTTEAKNRITAIRERLVEKEAIQEAKDAEVLIDRREAVRKIKEDVLHKKATANTSRMQAVKTQKVREEFNPYAEDMRRESVEISKGYMATGKRTYTTGAF